MKCVAAKHWPQYLLSFTCNIQMLCFGLHAGWLAPIHLLLISEESPVGRLTTEEISWIGSIPAVSFLPGTILYGFLLQRLGRRLSALLATLPNVLSFAAFIISGDVWFVYAGRFFGGLAIAGAILVTPVYVSECVGDNVRGFLCGLSAFFNNAGVLIASLAGGHLPYWMYNAVCLTFPLVFFIFYPWLPESPMYLLTKELNDEAEAAMRKLRVDITRIKEPEAATKSSTDLLSDGRFIYAIFLSIGVMTFHQLSGSPSVMIYPAMVFHEAGSALSPRTASTGISIMLLIGSVFGAFFMDKIGRKPLLVASLTIMSVILFSLSGFLRLRTGDEFGWVPAGFIFAHVGCFAAGIGSASFVVVTELFPPDVRGVSGAISGAWVSLIGFLSAKFFPVLVEEISLAPVFLGFAISCLVGAGFVNIFLVETRGRSSREIADLLKSRITKSARTDVEMANRRNC